MIKEACVEGFAEALRAQELGADRIELCENLAVGGTTPSAGTILTCRKYLRIPIVVMIRPRSGNFVYDETELEIMAEDIRRCRSAAVDGIAIGLLTSDGQINLRHLEILAHEAGNLKVTFHKAIDETHDQLKEFLRLRDSGLAARVLTSGGAPTALEGREMLNQMAELSGSTIKIIAAGRITSANLAEAARLIRTNEFHGKRIVEPA